MRAKPWHMKNVMNRYEMCAKIHINHAREALKCERRYEMRAKNQYSQWRAKP